MLVDPDLAIWAREHRVNVSGLLNDTLKELKRRGLDEPEVGLEELRKRRAEELVGAIDTATSAEVDERARAIESLRSQWNGYLGTGSSKPRGAKLSWLSSRASRYPVLRAISAEDLLRELGGDE